MLFDNFFGLLDASVTTGLLGAFLLVFVAITTGYVFWQARRERGTDCLTVRPGLR